MSGHHPSSTLGVESTRSGAEWTIAVSGELDLASAPALTQAYVQAEASDAERIVVDLSALAFIDSCGLRAVLDLDARSRNNGTRLIVRRGPDPVHRVFEITNTAERLPFR